MLPQDPHSASGSLVLISRSGVGFRLWALYLIILCVSSSRGRAVRAPRDSFESGAPLFSVLYARGSLLLYSQPHPPVVRARPELPQ